ncbi:MAG: AraC family transcriptional regulator [Akkermansiaceae bacterium]|nr:AraC family transcriptional regulator [Armatimonadota bacterium]
MRIVKTPKSLFETKTFGEMSQEWLVPFTEESILAARDIVAVGWVEAREGFSIYRPRPDQYLLFACLNGAGEVLVGGEWKACKPGMVFLAPKGQVTAYRLNAKTPEDYWHCCWIVALDDSIIQVEEPVLITASAAQLYRAIQGLFDENFSHGNPHYVAHWVDLIVHYGKYIGHPGLQTTNLLRPLWEKVIGNFSYPWTINKLVQESVYSEETLRRICLSETGYSPKEYVTFLRMRHAASLLVSNHSHSIQWISQRVGYTDPFAFSTAFRRIMGVSPSTYRKNMTVYGNN